MLNPVFSNVPPRIDISACASAIPRPCTSTSGSKRNKVTGIAKVVAGCCKATASEYTVSGSNSTVSSTASTADHDADADAKARTEYETTRFEISTRATSPSC